MLSTNFLPQDPNDQADDDSGEDDNQSRKEKKDTILRVLMSRDFAITVREEADVVEVIKGFSREFLMSETYLPIGSHIVSVYPLIEYKQVEQNQRKLSEDEEMKEPEARESSKVRKIDLSKK